MFDQQHGNWWDKEWSQTILLVWDGMGFKNRMLLIVWFVWTVNKNANCITTHQTNYNIHHQLTSTTMTAKIVSHMVYMCVLLNCMRFQQIGLELKADRDFLARGAKWTSQATSVCRFDWFVCCCEQKTEPQKYILECPLGTMHLTCGMSVYIITIVFFSHVPHLKFRASQSASSHRHQRVYKCIIFHTTAALWGDSTHSAMYVGCTIGALWMR